VSEWSSQHVFQLIPIIGGIVIVVIIIVCRLLGYYFPSTLSLCATQEGRKRLLAVALCRTLLYFILFVLGVWQVYCFRSDGWWYAL
jgi:uncharacterized membrane protein